MARLKRLAPVVKCLAFHFGFRGRLNRLNYFLTLLISYGVIAIIEIILVVFFRNWVEDWLENNWIFAKLGIVYPIWVLVATTSITIKRLHDMNRSGWWIPGYFVSFILFFSAIQDFGPFMPVIVYIGLRIGLRYIYPIIFLIWLFSTNGTKGTNRFGEDPKTKPKLTILLGRD
jgi:uncharacterized membrane protein YhaH (DUF805 family)